MKVHAYLNFDGQCEEALTFYTKALGAAVTGLMRFQDSPEPCPEGTVPPGSEGKVMHAEMTIGETKVMASDCNCTGKPTFQGTSLALVVPDAAAASKAFAALADGGAVMMPLGTTFWSPCFGVVADKFGLSWMVSAEA